MADKTAILSVGIDVGTSTTQVIFSRFTIENTSGEYMVPRIEITSKETTACRADIFTIEGKYVTTIYNGPISEKLSLTWTPPASGIYILKVIAGNEQTVKRIVVSR